MQENFLLKNKIFNITSYISILYIRNNRGEYNDFHHIRSGTRKVVGSLQYYLDNGAVETQRWKLRFPEISKYL